MPPTLAPGPTPERQPRRPAEHGHSASGPKRSGKRIRDISQLLEQAGYTIQPSPRRLHGLDDLYGLAITAGIVIPSETKAAC